MKRPKKFKISKSWPSVGDCQLLEIACPKDFNPTILTYGNYGDEFELSKKHIKKIIAHLKQVEKWMNKKPHTGAGNDKT